MSGTASIHSSIAELPPVLVLQLKRFEYDIQLQKMTKVCADVNFPSSLDLSPFCAPASATNAGMRDDPSLWQGKKDIWDMSTSALLRDPSAFTSLCNKITTASTEEASVVGSAVYDLTGVVRHIGRTEGAGHYICDVKLSAQERNSAGEGAKEWRRYDDSLVTALDQVRSVFDLLAVLVVLRIYPITFFVFSEFCYAGEGHTLPVFLHEEIKKHFILASLHRSLCSFVVVCICKYVVMN